MRPLNNSEIQNLSTLVRANLDYGLLEVTATGLGKSILDATQQFREFLQSEGVHDYDIQGQGPESKILLDAHLIDSDGNQLISRASLYRPATKSGDPRIWFSNLKNIASPGDVICVVWAGKSFSVMNLKTTSILELTRSGSKFGDYLSSKLKGRQGVHLELLHEISRIASRGWIRGLREGSTAVGHLLETELGISPNSSKSPDYKGIEIKSSAAKAKDGGRVTLFARVPTWPLSPIKSSAAILDNFGYWRGEDFKLYCTVSSRGFNSQGLAFEFDESARTLNEISTRQDLPKVAVWEESALLHDLKNKHGETFWVKARSQQRSDGTYFRYESIVHTQNPILSQFIPLISSGEITMDHLIKRKATGQTSEKGPLFKIQANKVDLLFPRPSAYDLSSH